MDTPGSAYGIAVADNLACVADRDFGIQVVDITSPTSPQLLARVETAGNTMDVEISGTNAYVAEAVFSQNIDKSFLSAVFPKVPAPEMGDKVGRYSALEIIDLSVPSTPLVTGTVETPGYALDVEVAGSHAYVADFYGMVVIDIADPGAPFIAASLATPGKARDLAIRGNYAYVADLDGLQVIDISDPTSPQLTGSYTTPGAAYGVAVAGPVPDRHRLLG